MDKETRNDIREATEAARKLLTEDFAEQLLADFNVHSDGRIDAKPRSPELTGQHAKIIAAIQHQRAAGFSAADAVADYLRDAAFTTLNRFVALKMLEARELVQQCVTKGEESSGYGEFCGLMPGLLLLPNRVGYRLYIESLFDELSTEVKVLFDRRDPAAVLWPSRPAFDQLLILLNETKLAGVWGEDETIGWVYQFFNSKEERAAMRESKKSGSTAPRNSRELAVRNQFFTPRYVVQFLTDNTLGRIWYEMRGKQTSLVERCEYLVRKPDETFEFRSKKDPRDLRVIDPACGSGHFLLYAFDLLLTIYEEAYADQNSPPSELSGRSLKADYPDIDALRRAMPGLVFAHNLHGVDIDPRCAQIAQLALWMRAQRAFRDFGIGRDQRPTITKSNIVVAEPLIADETTLRDFLARLKDSELERIFAGLIDTLTLAGDLGLLLRLENLVTPLVARNQTGGLFAPAKARIRTALVDFVSGGAAVTTQRRLFVGDAAHGIGLLEAAERRYDVVLMNPPFGEPTGRTLEHLRDEFPLSRGNILAHFIDRGSELLSPAGRIGAIISRTCFFLQSFVEFRKSVLEDRLDLQVFADFGQGVLDATVETAACVWSANPSAGGKTTFIRQLRSNVKGSTLLRCVSEINSATESPDVFSRDIRQFGVFPDRPYVYWIDDRISGAIAARPTIDESACSISVGLQTGDDFRFLRTWWEVDATGIIVPESTGDSENIRAQCIQQSMSGRPWAWYSKTEEALPILSSIHLVVKWRDSGAEIRAFHVGRGDSASKYVRSEVQYFKPGLSYMLRSIRLVPYLVPAGIIPTAGRSQVYPVGSDESWVAALLSSNVATATARFRGEYFGWPKFQNSMVAAVPYIEPESRTDLELAYAALVSVRSRRASSMRSDETEVLFVAPTEGDVAATNEGWSRDSILGEALELRFAELCGLTPQQYLALDRDRKEAQEAAGTAGSEIQDGSGEVEDVQTSSILKKDLSSNIARLSWLVGVAFGRFDPRLVTGERDRPLEPEPFNPQPSRSPGMWPVGNESVQRTGILVDDDGHANDLVARTRKNAEHVGYETPEKLRSWLAKDFFPLHIKMYTKSRRKAPIYWQLATPSASYSVWLYIHAFNRDTLFRVQNDYAGDKLRHEERKLESLRQEHGTNAGPAERRAIADQEAFVDELRGFLEEVRRVTPLWNPNLDDGVLLNSAPLWRLVPQNRAWQKELKTAWDGLCNEEYDWAHLAMHLWPERVVPKCATDRSLAIAHGLEAVFWVQGTDGKWTARATPTRAVAELVRERSSPAVKAALTSLLEAAAQGGAARKPRRGKAHA